MQYNITSFIICRQHSRVGSRRFASMFVTLVVQLKLLNINLTARHCTVSILDTYIRISHWVWGDQTIKAYSNIGLFKFCLNIHLSTLCYLK